MQALYLWRGEGEICMAQLLIYVHTYTYTFSFSGFAYGSGPHVIAFTETGDIYSWGHNGYYELGNGSSSQCLSPMVIGPNLFGKEVIEVACGSYHSLALTRDGEVPLFSTKCYDQNSELCL
jgi:alpha-tubulin suppressor-like RCC1 family protein